MKAAFCHFRPSIERLEKRLTPTNASATVAGVTLTISKASGDDNLRVTSGSAFGQLTVLTTPGNTINNAAGPFTTPSGVGIARVVVKLGTGNDTVTFDGTTGGGPINLTGGLSVAGTGGDKILSFDRVNLLHNAGASLNLTGNGAEDATFTDVNVAGAVNVNHPGVGNTVFTIKVSGFPGPNAAVHWGGLTIMNGQGSDQNSITDVNFSHSVTIANGPGEAGNTGPAGGCLTIISAHNDQNLLTIGGSVNVSTVSGESDTELYDYNVHGNVSIDSGDGIAGQVVGNSADVENLQTLSTSGIPTIGGNVKLAGAAVAGPSPGVTFVVGTDNPLFIRGNLKASATGTGSVAVDLSNLRIANGVTTITLGGQTHDDAINVAGTGRIADFNAFTVIAPISGHNQVNVQTVDGRIIFAGSVAIQMGGGDDSIQFGSANGPVLITGNLSISGSGGDKTITAQSLTLQGTGNLSLGLLGNGAETTSLTDTAIAGAATINHPGVGDTSVVIGTSGSPGADQVFKFGSLAIANGQGFDRTFVTDVDFFTGDVTINNGPGAGLAGSLTILSAHNDENLLTAVGNVTITSASGHSDTEVFDYNVNGNVAINAGPGSAGQSAGNFVGLENSQTFPTSGLPIIGGNVTITGAAVSGPASGLLIDLGTGVIPANLPLVIQGGLAINVSGAGQAIVHLNDLNVVNAATTLTLGSHTHDDAVSVGGVGSAAIFDDFNLTSAASGANTFNFQTQAGTLQFGGKVNVQLGSGNDTLDLAADAAHVNGIAGAQVDFFSTSTFNGGVGTNDLFKGTDDDNLFFTSEPKISQFIVH